MVSLLILQSLSGEIYRDLEFSFLALLKSTFKVILLNFLSREYNPLLRSRTGLMYDVGFHNWDCLHISPVTFCCNYNSVVIFKPTPLPRELYYVYEPGGGLQCLEKQNYTQIRCVASCKPSGFQK